MQRTAEAIEQMDAGLARVQHSAWQPPDWRPIPEWARENVELPPGYAQTGPIDLRQSPWMHEPLAALQSHRVQKVNVLKGLQSGGSLIGELFALYRIDQDPGPMVWNFQTEHIRDKVWRTRIGPLLRTSPCTKNILPQERHKRSRGVLSFPQCDVTIQGGGHNESNLQTLSYQIVINDEVWQWEPGMLYQAEGRADAFKSAKKIYNVSQGSERESDWDVTFGDGRVRSLVVKCPKCRKCHPMVWSHRMDDGTFAGVVWETRKRSDGSADKARAKETARYKCPICGYEHPSGESAQKKLVQTCAYSAKYPDIQYAAFSMPEKTDEIDDSRWHSAESFHWNSLVATPLADLVGEWLAADDVHKRGSMHLKKEFIQKKLACFYSDDMAEEKRSLDLSGYRMGDGYPGETHRFAAVDVQQGRGDDTPHLWVVIRAFVKGSGSSGLIWCGRVETEDEMAAMQNQYGLRPADVALDGRDDTRRVAAMCQRNGWTMLMGDDKESFPHYIKSGRSKRKVLLPYSPVQHYDSKKGKGSARFVKFLTWSNPTIKDMLYRLRNGNGVPWQLPSDIPEWYEEQIDSEIRRKVVKGGRWGHRWEPKVRSNPNNHIWDCECMALVRAMVAGVMPFDADLEQSGEEEPAETEVSPAD